jgi:hypothetical protein
MKESSILNQPIKEFFYEEPPRNNSMVNEIVLKARRKYLLFLGGTLIISLICFFMVYNLEYPALQNSLYLLLFCIMFFVLPAYIFYRLSIARTKTVAAFGQLQEGVIVTSKEFKGLNRVGIEVKIPDLKNVVINFALEPKKPYLVVGEKIPLLYHSECERIAIAYFKKCGFEMGHIVRINYPKWFISIGVVLAFLGILFWVLLK